MNGSAYTFQHRVLAYEIGDARFELGSRAWLVVEFLELIDRHFVHTRFMSALAFALSS